MRDLPLPGTLCSILQVRDNGTFSIPVLQSWVQEERKDTWSPFNLCSVSDTLPLQVLAHPKHILYCPSKGRESVSKSLLTSLSREVQMGHLGCLGGEGQGHQCHWSPPLSGQPHSGLPRHLAHIYNIVTGASTPITSPTLQPSRLPALNRPLLSAHLTR